MTLDLASGGGPIVVTPTNDTIFTALSTAALLAAQQANSALLTHMGELHLGTGSPKVQTALAATAPTQVAFTGTADQLADLLPAIPQAVGQMGGWFKAIGSFASLDGSISTPGFDTQAGGFLAGFDKAVSANLTVGIAAGYLHTNLSEAGGASGSIDTPRLAVYGSYTLGDFAIDATAGYAYDFINSSRPFATLGQTASSSYNGQEANAALQVSTRANFAGITFMPAAGLAYVHVAQNGVSESGAPGFNLSVNGNSANSLRPFVGLTAAKSYTTDGGMVITPEADIAYSYETLNTTPPSLIQVGGGSFTVPGLMPSRSQLTLGGGITAQLTDTLAFEAAYHITPPTGNLSARRSPSASTTGSEPQAKFACPPPPPAYDPRRSSADIDRSFMAQFGAGADAGELLAAISRIAEQAGREILRHYHPGVEARLKHDRTPVTAADEAAEAIILPALRELAPAISSVAEEAVAHGGLPEIDRQSLFFLIDPLDGTREFLAGNGEFTVNIALIDKGRPILGVVHLPALGTTYAGGPGRDASRSPARRRNPSPPAPSPAMA